MMRRILVLLIVAAQSSVCHAFQLNCTYSEMAQFVHYLYDYARNHDRVLRYALNDSEFKYHRATEEDIDEDELLFFRRHPDAGMYNFFCELVQLRSMDDIDQVLCTISDPVQRKCLLDKIQAIYTTYLQQSSTGYICSSKVHRRLQALQKVINHHQSLIDEFIECLSVFYGAPEIPYSDLTIYLCSSEENAYAPTSFYANNVIFLGLGSSGERLEHTLGTVLHEVAHLFYEHQNAALKKDIDHFFLHYPSQYGYMAYQKFDEALATALGNGVFVEKLTGSPGMIYEDQYIQGFAEAIYEDVKALLNKRKTIDKTFLVKCVKRFAKRFPDASSNLSELLTRYELFTSNFLDREKVYNLFQKHLHACSVFRYPLHNPPRLDVNMPYYDCNAPCIFVLSSEEREKLAELRNLNPYLKSVKKSQLKNLEKELSFHRDKQGRLCLFFVAADYTHLEKLVEEFKQKYL